MKRKINVSMDDLLIAFNMNDVEYIQYLNLETGGIAILSQMGDSLDEEGNKIEDPGIFEAPDKYILIPGSGSSEVYRNMGAFIQKKVTNKRLSTELRETLNTRRPFRHFKDVLMNHPRLDAEWFKFEEESIKKRIHQWLTDNNLELEEE